MIGSKRTVIEWLKDQPDDKEFEIEIRKKKRSLSTNAYYWVLLTKLANALHTSKDELHEIMLQRYGYFFINDGDILTVKIPAKTPVPDGWHMQFVYDWGGMAVYNVLRGSHTYNSKEMTHLLDGLISECKEADVETLPPHEINKLRGYFNGEEITQHHHG